MAFDPNDPKLAQTSDTMFQGYLDPEQAQDYFAEAEKFSIVQQVARKIPMGATGVKIPHWTGDVTAEWLGEGEMKPITKGNLTKQVVKPAKIATIFTASAEVVRANPANYLGTMRTKVGTAIALAFDAAVLHGTNTPFGAYIDQTTKKSSIANAGAHNAYKGIAVNGLNKLVTAGKKWTGTLLDDISEPILNGALDASDRPLFVESTYDSQVTPFRSGRIVGRQTVLSDHVANGTTVGYMGDWNQIVWGQVGGLSFDVSDQATLNFGTEAEPNFVSLWQHNLVAVRVEAEYGVLVNDPNAFVKLTNVPDPVTYTLSLGGADGGNYTLTLNGIGPSATIAHNASASTVKTAIVGIDDGVAAADVTVTGSAGTYTVTVPGTLTANFAALTNATSPALTVTG